MWTCDVDYILEVIEWKRADLLCLMNDKGRYSLWPVSAEVPASWTVVHGPQTTSPVWTASKSTGRICTQGT